MVAGLAIGSYIEGNIPLTFTLHQVVYENIGCVSPLTPTYFYARVNGPSSYPFERNVLIPDTKHVGIYSFKITDMANMAFQQTGIKSLEVKGEIRTIPQSAFMYCDELETVQFHGNAPKFVDAFAFRGCTKLKSISFPAQLQYIGDYAFQECKSLQSIYLPKDLASLGKYAFKGCTSLSSVTFATGHFRVIPEYCFHDCQNLQSVVIPNGVSTLGEYSFCYSGLKTITLPATMQLIEQYALANTPLTEIKCHAAKPPIVRPNFTYDRLAEITVHVPVGSEQAYLSDTFWKYAARIIPDL